MRTSLYRVEMQVRWILLVLVLLAVLVVLLGPRREGAEGAPSKKCGQSLIKSSDAEFQYGKNKDEPPLDPKQCKNRYIRRGKTCYLSKNNKWVKENDASKCKQSWMGVVDWKAAHKYGKTAGGLFRVSGLNKTWKRQTGYDATDFDTNSGMGGLNGDYIPNAQECAKRCTETAGCAGFVMSKKKDTDKQYRCWGRKANTTDGKLSVAKRTTWPYGKGSDWSLYTMVGATGATGTTDSTGVSTSGGCGTGVTVYYDAKGQGESKTLPCGTYQGGGLPFSKTFTGKGSPNISHVSEMSSIRVPWGVKATLKSPNGTGGEGEDEVFNTDALTSTGIGTARNIKQNDDISTIIVEAA